MARPPRPGRTRSPLAKHLRRLVVGGTIIFLLSLCLLPSIGTRRHGRWYADLYFAKGPQGVEAIGLDRQGRAAWWSVRDPEKTLYSASGTRGWIGGSGWFSFTQRFNHTLTIDWYDGPDESENPLTPEDIDAVYGMFAAAIWAEGNIEGADAYLRGPGVETRIGWDKVYGAMIRIAALLMASYLLGWFLETVLVAFASVNDDEFFDPESGRYIRCPNCKYDLKGLPTTVCPECGTECAPAGQQRP